MRETAVLLSLLCGLAFPTLAHEGHAHKVMGTVTQVHIEAVTHVEVQTTDEKTVVLTCDEHTKFTKGKAAATVKDLQTGSRIVATVAEEGKIVRALEVTIGEAAATPETKHEHQPSGGSPVGGRQAPSPSPTPKPVINVGTRLPPR